MLCSVRAPALVAAKVAVGEGRARAEVERHVQAAGDGEVAAHAGGAVHLAEAQLLAALDGKAGVPGHGGAVQVRLKHGALAARGEERAAACVCWASSRRACECSCSAGCAEGTSRQAGRRGVCSPVSAMRQSQWNLSVGPVRPNSSAAASEALPTSALARRWLRLSMGPEGGTPTCQSCTRPGQSCTLVCRPAGRRRGRRRMHSCQAGAHLQGRGNTLPYI